METLIKETSQTDTPNTAEKHEHLRAILDIVETILLAVVMFIGINAISARVRVDGRSMVPTLKHNEFVLVSRIAYKFWEPNRGDIVVFHYPYDPTQDYIKRIIGIPGDTVKIQSGKVTVNGTILEEPYIAEDPAYEGTWSVHPDTLFVLGDNRNDSSDGHIWGLLPFKNVIGKAIFIYWPFTEFNLIDHFPLAVATP